MLIPNYWHKCFFLGLPKLRLIVIASDFVLKLTEVKWFTDNFLWTKVLCTLGWPYTKGNWLYCDYFIWCISCTVVVLTCFVMCGWVCVWGCVGVFWQLCRCLGNMCTCIYCVLYCLYCVFVLFRFCIRVFSFIYFVCTSVQNYCQRVKTQLQ